MTHTWAFASCFKIEIRDLEAQLYTRCTTNNRFLMEDFALAGSRPVSVEYLQDVAPCGDPGRPEHGG
jgi:hypothetical protein